MSDMDRLYNRSGHPPYIIYVIWDACVYALSMVERMEPQRKAATLGALTTPPRQFTCTTEFLEKLRKYGFPGYRNEYPDWWLPRLSIITKYQTVSCYNQTAWRIHIVSISNPVSNTPHLDASVDHLIQLGNRVGRREIVVLFWLDIVCTSYFWHVYVLVGAYLYDLGHRIAPYVTSHRGHCSLLIRISCITWRKSMLLETLSFIRVT
jgi:hypothetical protein